MYRNFICYRGGSSAGIFFAEDIYKRAKENEDIIGKTYYSPINEDGGENRNFINDPKKYICDVKNFIMLLTKDFLEDFIVNDKPNEESITRIEIDEALKNENIRFIPVMWPDFSWKGETNGRNNKSIITELWGEEASNRITGSLPIIQFIIQYKKQVIEQIIAELDSSNSIKEIDPMKFDGTFRLESTPTVMPKTVFCGREEILEDIKNKFESGERLIFLQGIGGIGKTEIAKQYAKRNRDKYDTIIYATYNNSIVELISSQTYFKIEPQFPRHVLTDGTQEDDISYFNRKLKLLRNITNERTLIIIDNFDVMNDEHFKDILDANYKLLITTRCDYSRYYATIKIEPLDSIEQLKNVFLENYQGYMVDADDERLEELIELVNRHTYTIELIAQHMENSGQTIDEMIDVLKNEGIVSLNEEIRSASDGSSVAYENLVKMFKVFNLNSEEQKVLQLLSLMPLSGVNAKDLRNWLGPQALHVIKNLENRSWVISEYNGIALHPIIREVVRFKLPIKDIEAEAFLAAFNETIKEEKTWHYPIDVKNYYADIALEIIKTFNKINEHTLRLYLNTELLCSFSIKPPKAVELIADLYNYFCTLEGGKTFMCGYCAFQAGWTYLFNLHLPDAFNNAKEWLLIGYNILKDVKLETENHFAVYGHLLTHLARAYLMSYEDSEDIEKLNKAREYAELAVINAEAHFDANSNFYSRLAVAYMQLADVCIVSNEFEKALTLVNDAYNIVYLLFGAKDPDALNVSSRKSNILYNLGRYKEALDIGRENIESYTSFYGELNYLRFEQLMIVLKCYIKLGDVEQAKIIKEDAIRIGSQLLSEDSKPFKELMEL